MTDTKKREGSDSLNELVMPWFRVLLSRMDVNRPWEIISNPDWNVISRACNTVLTNFANDYAEYKNCGVTYRLIRLDDVEGYGVEREAINREWMLNPNDA